MKKLLFITIALVGMTSTISAQARRTTDPFGVPPPPPTRPRVVVAPSQPRVVLNRPVPVIRPVARPVVVRPVARPVIVRPVVVAPEPVVVKHKKHKHGNKGLHKGHYKNGKAFGYRERKHHSGKHK